VAARATRRDAAALTRQDSEEEAMQLRHDSLVLVADGRKALFLRNEGDGVHPNLVVEHAEERINPADHDQKSDGPGSMANMLRSPRSTVDEADFHRLEEDRFAVEIAATLKQRALANEFESLIVAAPPHTLGELRKHYHLEVANRLAGEIPKDLTGHPILEIEKALTAA
jgi:protein required for attachment to host cells